MHLTHFHASQLAELEAALRAGEDCVLATDKLPSHIRSSQLLPCFDAVEVRSHSLRDSLSAQLPAPGRPACEGPAVTALIPTHRQTPIGLAALRDQDLPVETLVLSNGTVQVDGDRVLKVPWLGHGPTRQRALDFVDTEYVLFTVDDALPRGRGAVRALVDALEEGGYEGVFGRQIPWPTADAVTRTRLAQWTPAGDGHWPAAQTDHVWALYRTKTLREHPLPAVPIGEDMAWSKGRRVGYVPGSLVMHSHKRNPKALFQRTRDLHLQHQLSGDAATVPTLGALIKALPGVLGPTVRSGPKELPNQLAELWGQWRASKIKKG